MFHMVIYKELTTFIVTVSPVTYVLKHITIYRYDRLESSSIVQHLSDTGHDITNYIKKNS